MRGGRLARLGGRDAADCLARGVRDGGRLRVCRDAADCASGARRPGCGRLRVWREAAGMRPTACLARGGRDAADCVSGARRPACLVGGCRDAADCVSGVRLPGCGRLRVWREAAGMRPTACLA